MNQKTNIPFIVLHLLLFSLSGIAQNYQPFFTSGNTFRYQRFNDLHYTRIDSVYASGADSVFLLSRSLRQAPGVTCPSPEAVTWGHDGLFGREMRKTSNGDYQFCSITGDTIFLRPQLPMMTPWQFHSDSTLTAMIISRDTMSFLGVTDSVLTIAISDGRQIKLSRAYGLWQAPNFSAYFEGGGMDDYHYVALPSGGEQDIRNWVHWRVGDFYDAKWGPNGGAQHFRLTRQELIQQFVNPAADTMINTWWTAGLEWYAPADTIPTGHNIFTDTLTLQNVVEEGYLSNHAPTWEQQFWYIDTGGDSIVNIMDAHFQHSQFGMRPVEQWTAYAIDTCGGVNPAFGPLLTYQRRAAYGLGITESESSQLSPFASQNYWMVCYRTASDSLGPCDPMINVALGNKADEMRTKFHVTVYPNPARDRIFVRLKGGGIGEVEYRLTDLVGRHVAAPRRVFGAVEAEEFALDLSIGTYLLHVRTANAHRTVRVVVGR